MKLIYLIAGTYRPAGMERVLANKVSWLASHGYEILIVTTDQMGRKPFFELPSGVRTVDLGIGYEQNNGASFLNKLIHYPFKQARHRKLLTALLERERPDITISMFCNDASFLPRIHDGSRKVLEIHFSKYKRIQYGRKGLWALADRYLSWRDERNIRRFDAFVVLTKEDRAYWGNVPNITVIPNACTLHPSGTADLDTPKAVSVGRLSFQKGYDRLIAAWKIVAASPLSEGWTLDIVGGGELQQELQEQIDAAGLEEKVRLVPPTSDMDSVYLRASFLVLSSRFEGLPMVLLEAQTYGLPLVAFDCKCGPKDVIIDGENGLIAREGDVDELAEKILEMMSDSGMRHRMGEASQKTRELYSEERVMGMWNELFRNLKDA